MIETQYIQMLSMLCKMMYLFLATMLRTTHSNYFHFTDVETKSQRAVKVTP